MMDAELILNPNPFKADTLDAWGLHVVKGILIRPLILSTIRTQYPGPAQ